MDSCGTQHFKCNLPRVFLDYFQTFLKKPQGCALDQVITGVLRVSASALCVKWP